MGFWGIEVKPGKPYQYRSGNGKLNVTQATLGIGSARERSIIQCSIGENCPIFLCSLLPNKIECCPLNLEFEDDDSVAFSVIGPRSIHLSGIVVANGEDSAEDDYYLDSFGEDIAETETEESTDYDTENEYEDDFIDDSDLEMYSQSPIPNSGVVIEEIVDDEKRINGNERSKELKKNKSSDSKDNKYSQHQIVVKNNRDVLVLESEDEDGFPISTTQKRKLATQKPQSESEETDRKTTEKPKKKKEKDGGYKATNLKRKVESVDQDDQPKKQKKKKKQKEKGKVGKVNEAGTEDNLSVHVEDENQPEEVKIQTLNQAFPVGNEHDQKLFNEKILDTDQDRVPSENYSDTKKKKKKNKKKAQGSEAGSNMSQTITDTGDMSSLGSEKKTEAKSSQVRTFANGLVIEELSMGKPDGKRASPGKKVSVHYIGKLKKNGKIFDSNVGRAPFKFRLGVGHVIKGWEVGVKGMRVGDKRRLTVPPSMGYGSENVGGGTIPPNSWLVFDIELANVS